jgi:hypothetical protein
MSDSENKSSKLLGKKREKESEKESSSEDNKGKKLKKEEESESESSESNKPRKSLFGENEKGFTGGLFGDLDNPNKTTSLFGDNSKSGSLFGNTSGSLFGDSKSKEEDNKNSLFGKGLFDFSSINNKKEEEYNNEEEGGDDNIGKSNSPKHEYNPEEEDEKEETDGYIKRYAKKVDNTLLYDLEKKSFVSKGEGFIIIETQEDKENKKRFARIVYRNLIGGIIFQGILNDKINKCHPYEKKLKHICHIFFLMTKGDKENNLSLAQAKILFVSQEEIKKFEMKYIDAIKYIKNEIDKF